MMKPMIEHIKSTTLFIGPIRVTVKLVDVIETDGPHLEVQTCVTSTIEGELNRWTTSTMFEDWEDAQKQYAQTTSRFKRMETL